MPWVGQHILVIPIRDDDHGLIMLTFRRLPRSGERARAGESVQARAKGLVAGCQLPDPRPRSSSSQGSWRACTRPAAAAPRSWSDCRGGLAGPRVELVLVPELMGGVFGVTEEEVLRPCPNCGYAPPAGFTCRRCGASASEYQEYEVPPDPVAWSVQATDEDGEVVDTINAVMPVEDASVELALLEALRAARQS